MAPLTGMRVFVATLVLLAACGDDDGGGGLAPDAAVDASLAADAPACTPGSPPAPGPTCLALAPGDLAGTTPLGTFDAPLTYVGAGDCITISQATVRWDGPCGEDLWLHFSYPVSSGADGKRHVAASFDADARLRLEPMGEDVTTIHVEVVEWQEGEGVHDIDMTITFTEPGYTVAPIHVQGTFCDWAYLLC